MVSYARPGVYVEESLRTRNPDAVSSASAAVFIAAHPRGPDEPHLVRSWSDFTRVFGGFPAGSSLLPYAVFQFFNNGGREAFVQRVVGAGSIIATTDFDDQGTTPAPTLDVEAVNAGEWGNDLRVQMANAGDDNFNLTVYLGAQTRSNIVERFTDLSMNPDDSRYVESVVNSIISGSSYITVHDLGSSNFDAATPNYDVIRPAEAVKSLTGGDDGAEPVAADLTDVLPNLEGLNRSYVLNYPGVHDEAVVNAALTHVEENGQGFVVIDPPSDLTPEAAVTHGETLNRSGHGAIYYPYLQIADAGSNGRGNTRLVPPGGAICGIYAATDASRGPWKAPAGLTANLSGIVSTERRLTADDLETLNEGHVNAIRHAPGAGFVVWGARTLKRSQADKYIPIRRTLIFLKRALQTNTAWAVFEPNDSILWGTLQSTIESYLTGIWQQGGLRGNSPTEAFYVKSDADINPLSAIEAGVVNAEIGVALQYPAEFVVIKLSQWEGGASTADSATA